MMFFSQDKPIFSSVFKFLKTLLIVFITAVIFLLFFFEIKDKISPDMTLCRRVQMIHDGQDLDSALQIIGRPDTIFYHESFAKLSDVNIYTYNISGPSSGPVRMFVREGKVLEISGCK